MPTAPAELDQVTLRRAQQGESAAFRALVDRYHRPVHALLWRMVEHTAGAARAEELVQDTFVRVHKGLGTFKHDGPARLSTWILTIATRVALNEVRRKRPPTTTLDEAANLASPDRADSQLERRRLGAAIRSAIAQLSANQRAVLILREYHELNHNEIANILDIDLGTVKSRLSRARARLRSALGEVRE